MAGSRQIPLLVVCGPTASGKTDLAVALAKRLDGEVVSADSMQIYRNMNIGTAKPTAEEMGGIPHHLLDFLPPEDTFSLAEYLILARKVVNDITNRGKLPILAGGTGLYIQSLVDNLHLEDVDPQPQIRQALEDRAAAEGPESLWRELQACDPDLAEKLHPNNLGRIVRALEVYQTTGVTMSETQRRSRLNPSPYQACMLGLCFQNRQTLYDRIDLRVDRMMEQGLEAEARALWEGGSSKTASQAIGYKELFACFQGACTLEEAVDRIKQGTRRYAKRQMTWFRRDSRIHWLAWESFPSKEALYEHAASIAGAELTR